MAVDGVPERYRDVATDFLLGRISTATFATMVVEMLKVEAEDLAPTVYDVVNQLYWCAVRYRVGNSSSAAGRNAA